MASRDAIGRADVVDPRAYERLRPRYRELVARRLAARRVRLGEAALVLFENRETVLWQIHEVLRCEGATPSRIDRVLAEYEVLLPPPGELRATVMIDGVGGDVARRIARALRRVGGLDLRCGPYGCTSDPVAPNAGVTEPIHYVRWHPPSKMREGLLVHGFGPHADVFAGLEYRSDGRGLLPHAHVTTWIAGRIAELRPGPFRAAATSTSTTDDTMPIPRCVFRKHSGAHSGSIRAPVPARLGHSFRSTRALIPEHSGTDSGALGHAFRSIRAA